MSTSVLVAVLCVSCVVALSSACCTPAQWEGQQSAIASYADGKTHKLLNQYSTLSYDAINNRTSFFFLTTSGVEVAKIKIVVIYDNKSGVGKQYVLDYIKGVCYTSTLKIPFSKSCVPDEAKPVGDFSLGLSALNITGYAIPTKGAPLFLSVENIGNNECVPVSESRFGKEGQADILQQVVFFNITAGIKNETVFDIPKECKKVEEFNLGETLFLGSFIMGMQ